jgi:DNA-binding NtrC family response regulator
MSILFLGSEDHLSTVRLAAGAADLNLEAAESPADLLARLELHGSAVVVAEYPFSDLDPEVLMQTARAASLSAPVVFLMSHEVGVSEAVRLARMGAYECLGPQIEADRLTQVLEDAKQEFTNSAATASGARDWRSKLVGASASMENLAQVIELVAARRCTVLITGETGTGKEMAARAIHMASDRSRHPMVAVNCSAIPENLLEAELFGHTKGAFTGAANMRIGRFEQANNGTLFLDEIGEMPIDLQAKLLRVLQERELQRLGSSDTIKVNVRVIAASNVNLAEQVKAGKFREDLYYRLNVVPVEMPPLRERSTDVPLLARHFVEKVCRMEGIPVKQVYNEALEHLQAYSWPGNVRQLENLVEKAIVMSGSRPVLHSSDFVLPTAKARVSVPRNLEGFSLPEGGIDLAETVTIFEKNIVDEALKRTKGNKTLAAALLRLKRTTLISKLRMFEDATRSAPAYCKAIAQAA